MRVGSLFSGIGGLDLGLERAGMQIVWQVENDDFCTQVLAKHWPNVARFRDVRECGSHNLEPVDLICGGFPCQPTSHAGLKRGQQDERWLWPEMLRIICVLGPRLVLVENPPGLLSQGFGGVLRDLASAGFDAEWTSLRASQFGAPHRRSRVYLVAYTNGVNGTPWLGSQQDGAPSLFATHHRELNEVWVEAAPSLDRVDDGLPAGLYRPQVGALGNAVVPQVAEYVGRRIMDAAGRD